MTQPTAADDPANVLWILVEESEQAPAAARHLPGKHDQSTHGKGGKKQPAAAGQAALDAVPLGRLSPELSPAERASLNAYIKPDGFRTINGSLRGEIAPILPGSKEDKRIRGLDRVTKRSETTGRIEVWRGMHSGQERLFGDRLGGNMTGMEWHEKAFTSTSARKSASQEFAGQGVLMRIHARPGIGAVKMDHGIHDGEGEILLQRDLKFRVVADHGIDPVWKYRSIDVEVI